MSTAPLDDVIPLRLPGATGGGEAAWRPLRGAGRRKAAGAAGGCGLADCACAIRSCRVAPRAPPPARLGLGAYSAQGGCGTRPDAPS